MQHTEHSTKKNLGSLRRQYLIAATLVSFAVMLGAVITNWHVQQVSNDNTSALKLRVHANKVLSVVRSTLWEIDVAMNAMLASPTVEDEKKIIRNIESVRNEVDALLVFTQETNSRLIVEVKKLRKELNILDEKIQFLLKKRKDGNWVYPILPFVEKELFSANNEFENAVSIALHAIAEDDGRTYASVRYGQFDQLRDAWRYKILNFRMLLIGFASVDSQRLFVQEESVESTHELIEEKLVELAGFQKKGELELDPEFALSIMQEANAKWYKGWQYVKSFHENNAWRNDTKFMQAEIRPTQETIFVILSKLDNELFAISGENLNAVQEMADMIGLELWGFFGLALVFVIGVYLLIDRSILRPIARISEALSAEGEQVDYELERQGSQEINQLASSFRTMRKQIHQRQDELQVLALHDALTGLPNRTLFTDRLEQAIRETRRTDQHMAVLLLDLDRFKDINDVLGHPVGDCLLQEVSVRLASVARESDTVARFGGDEFAIVLPATNSVEAVQFAARMANIINEVFVIESQSLYVGSSIGIAIYPEHGKDVDTLIRHSDVAMYVAKKSRRDFSVYKESHDEGNACDLVLVESLHNELESARFLKLHYQPQIDLFSRDLIGVEALLRWTHPEVGVVSPENIVQIAENSGLIDQLTDWVIKTAVAECKDIIESEKLHFSINLSAKNLHDSGMPERIGVLLKAHGVSCSSLTLEVTETAMMHDPDFAIETMNKLSAMGIKLSIDDYGTGFSSLGYLKRLPVDELKIDKSFVINMLEDKHDAIIVQSTIELAHKLGLRVVAEGVENLATLHRLRGLQCDTAQGYFIARPMSRSELNMWLSTYSSQLMNG